MKHNASQMCNERSARTQYVVLILGWGWALLTPLQNTKYRNYEIGSFDKNKDFKFKCIFWQEFCDNLLAIKRFLIYFYFFYCAEINIDYSAQILLLKLLQKFLRRMSQLQNLGGDSIA